MKTGDDIDKAEIVHKESYNKEQFVIKLAEMHTSDKYSTSIMQQLPEEFEYATLKDLFGKASCDQSVKTEKLRSKK